MSELYRFGTVTVEVWPHRHHLVTRFADGTTVDACPHPTVDYRERALDLGYTGLTAAWQMCRDHELYHSYLALLYLGTVSPTLWAVAHGQPTAGRPDIDHEEQVVMRCQATHRGCPFPHNRER